MNTDDLKQAAARGAAYLDVRCEQERTDSRTLTSRLMTRYNPTLVPVDDDDGEKEDDRDGSRE